MLLRVPDFYDSFHCIAGKCTDTCCVGWEIDIDEKSAKRYEKIKGEYGEILRSGIEDGHFKLLPGDRCPFLRRDGLCDMICHLGEDCLCDICREHPRFVEVYGDIMEKGLGLCCEEAVRLLLEAKGTASSPIAFVEREIEDEPDEIPDDAIEARNAIFEEREHLFKILADQSRPLNERLIELLDFAIEASGFEDLEQDNCNFSTSASDHAKRDKGNKISNNILRSWIEILGKGESYGPAWDRAYTELAQVSRNLEDCKSRECAGLFTDRDGEKIIAYLLFRYYEKSLFDGDSLTKVQFALYFWLMLQKFGSIFANAGSNANNTSVTNTAPEARDTQTAKINAIKLFSKQTEYSEEIMGILEEAFIENSAFSPENFRRFLAE